MKKFCLALALVSTLNMSNSFIVTNADDRDNIKNKIEEQEDIIGEELNEFQIEDLFNESNYYDELQKLQDENVDNSTGEFSTKKIINNLREMFYKFLINTRTYSIIGFIILCVLAAIYAATFGSRDVSKRRKAYLLVRNFFVLFMIYINTPLFILWIKSDKTALLNIDFINVFVTFIEFLQSNSIIICILIAYSGFHKYIISKNNLPLYKTGIYQMKFSLWLFIILNIITPTIKFLL